MGMQYIKNIVIIVNLQKNHVGFIPINYTDYGFNISAKIVRRNPGFALNEGLLDDHDNLTPSFLSHCTATLLSKVDTVLLSENIINLSILIGCPYAIKIWKLFFKCVIRNASFRFLHLVVSGTNTDIELNTTTEWGYEKSSINNDGWTDFYWQLINPIDNDALMWLYRHDRGIRQNLLSQSTSTESVGTKYFNILKNTPTPYKYYKIVLYTGVDFQSEVPTSINDIFLALSDFQLYTYKD